MSEQKKINYFTIGLFFLFGLAFIVASIIFFSSKSLLQKVVYAETYFNESVEGLSKGSAIKYQGMEIGTIDDISIVENIYPAVENNSQKIGGEYVYVKMAIYPNFLKKYSSENLDQKMKQLIARGLRVKLSLQGLTGNAYVDMYFDTKKSGVLLPIYWTPANYYIPSVPSTLSYFSDNAQYLLQELRQIDFKKIFNSIQMLVNNTDKFVNNTNQLVGNTYQVVDNSNKFFLRANNQAVETLNNLRLISQDMKQVSDKIKADPPSILFAAPPEQLDLNKL